MLTNQTSSSKVKSRIQAFVCQLPPGKKDFIVLNLVYYDAFVIVDSEGIFGCASTRKFQNHPLSRIIALHIH